MNADNFKYHFDMYWDYPVGLNGLTWGEYQVQNQEMGIELEKIINTSNNS